MMNVSNRFNAIGSVHLTVDLWLFLDFGNTSNILPFSLNEQISKVFDIILSLNKSNQIVVSQHFNGFKKVNDSLPMALNCSNFKYELKNMERFIHYIAVYQ